VAILNLDLLPAVLEGFDGDFVVLRQGGAGDAAQHGARRKDRQDAGLLTGYGRAHFLELSASSDQTPRPIGSLTCCGQWCPLSYISRIAVGSTVKNPQAARKDHGRKNHPRPGPRRDRLSGRPPDGRVAVPV